MKKENTSKRTTKLAVVINIILIVINFLLAFGIIVLNFSRGVYTEITKEIFMVDKPLMNSALLDFLLRKEFSIFIIVLLVWIAIKERRRNPIKRRIILNLYPLIGLTAYNALLLYIIYMPIIHANLLQ